MYKAGVFMYITKKQKERKKILLALFLCVIILVVLIFGDSRVRKILDDYSTSYAQNILINAANEAITELFEEETIAYGDMVKLSRDEAGKVTSLEIGIEKLNLIRSKIAVKINEKLLKRSDYLIKVPIGTFMGYEFTVGRGPKVTFKMRLAGTVIADFESRFTAAGINQVLHQIIIRIKMNGKVLIPWYNTSFTSEITSIAAQTVIVGITPETYTNVTESGTDGIADDIFNFGFN